MTTNNDGSVRKSRDQGANARIQAWVRNRPGRLISLDDVEKGTRAERSTIAGSLMRMERAEPDLIKKGRGLYVWAPRTTLPAAPAAEEKPAKVTAKTKATPAAPAPAAAPGQLLLEVLADRPDKNDKLVRDTADGSLYLLTRYNF